MLLIDEYAKILSALGKPTSRDKEIYCLVGK